MGIQEQIGTDGNSVSTFIFEHALSQIVDTVRVCNTRCFTAGDALMRVFEFFSDIQEAVFARREEIVRNSGG